jgi:hypothetical protein
MAIDSEPAADQAHDRQVPDALLQKLHDATERFHAAKKLLDLAMDSSELGHGTTVERATNDLRTAEREVEQITMLIHGTLKQPPSKDQNH